MDSSILIWRALAGPGGVQWRSPKTIPIFGAQAPPWNGYREVYHIFCNIVGGVISPLLANIALHGLEIAITQEYPQAKVIRYADDLVVLHSEDRDKLAGSNELRVETE
jgi:hypothetical protein